MGESVFSLRKKPPRLTKGVPAFSFPVRRLSSGRRKCSRADCASRVLPLRAWASSRRVVFASAPPSPIPLFSRQALPSSSVPSRPASWSVPAAGRAGHDLSHGLKARRYSCSFVLRRQLTLKGASDSPNFGCPELSGETVPDAEVACPANFRALCVPHRGGVVLPFGQARRSLPSGRCSAFPAVACLPAASVCDGRLRLAVLGTCGGGLPSPPPLMGLCRIV